MCDQTPPKSRDDTPALKPHRMTVDHLQRAAKPDNFDDPLPDAEIAA
jgi:hypothetical protein